jgi:hypothetical protein
VASCTHKNKRLSPFFILIKLKKWLGFYFYECIALFAMYLDKNYIANNAAALHRKNHTQKPLYRTAENLIHIDLQPIWHVHKFLSFKNFVHKKIFSCCKPPSRPKGGEGIKKAACIFCKRLNDFLICIFLLSCLSPNEGTKQKTNGSKTMFYF